MSKGNAKAKMLKLIDEFNKSGREVIRTQLTRFHGQRRLDIRTWVFKDGDYIPTEKGVNLRIDQVDSLKRAIDKAAKEVEKT